MTDGSSQEPVSAPEYPGDRRKPVARYVEFADEKTQERFISAAEHAYVVLLGADRFAGTVEVDLSPDPPPPPPEPERRGLFRRSAPPPEPPPKHVAYTTAALARVAADADEIPRELDSSAQGCADSRRVARTLAVVATDLVGDLWQLDPADQAPHPAYRQTLRLAAELEAVREIVNQVGCGNPEGCVGIRPPDNWGRRIEDVEVTEVRAVLHRLAVAGDQ